MFLNRRALRNRRYWSRVGNYKFLMLNVELLVIQMINFFFQFWDMILAFALYIFSNFFDFILHSKSQIVYSLEFFVLLFV